ncbi:hypothetical protein [Staphylococcus warneri]|uniref:hypothetical protein n=1 Tax=Staphylococcus warneri TaxID=1292 RepID=UPI001A8FEECD|nr:hypothetical protein [Staphylococcus warneri]MBO0377109.1 hypothetical protein [Staphylococcus warneri]
MFKRKKQQNNNNDEEKQKLKSAKKKDKKNKSAKKKEKLTKEEKKAIKEKRKAFKKNQVKYDVEGGIGGDKDPRTRRDVRTMFVAILGFILIIAGFVSGGFGFKAYRDFQNNNTTELGSTLEFKHSDGAKVNINEVWTDKNRDVTVAKIGYPDSSREILSSDGKNYKLYLRTSEKKPNVKLAYGILGGKGDGYLFIKGKQKDQAYNVGIENTMALTTKSINNSSASDTSISDSKDDEDIETAISSMNENGETNSAIGDDEEKVKSAKSKHDFIKIIINPYSESTKVYKGSFLDASGNIDYSKVVKQTGVQGEIDKINKELKKRNANLKKLENSKKEFEKRIKDQEKKDKQNKKDKKDKDKSSTSSKTDDEESLDDIKKSIDKEKDGIKKLEDKKTQFENADFSKESFGSMQEKSKVY